MSESSDLLNLLEADHRRVEELFDTLDAAADAKLRTVTGREIITSLVGHAAAEEQILYPLVRRILGAELAEAAIAEHADLERVLAEVDGKTAEDPGFDSGMQKVRELVGSHVEDEEASLFTALRNQVGAGERQKLGRALQAAKLVVPTHPHPSAPDRPPLNLVTGPMAGVIDRARDVVRAVRERV